MTSMQLRKFVNEYIEEFNDVTKTDPPYTLYEQHILYEVLRIQSTRLLKTVNVNGFEFKGTIKGLSELTEQLKDFVTNVSEVSCETNKELERLCTK
jgi:hypothetical protein